MKKKLIFGSLFIIIAYLVLFVGWNSKDEDKIKSKKPAHTEELVPGKTYSNDDAKVNEQKKDIKDKEDTLEEQLKQFQSEDPATKKPVENEDNYGIDSVKPLEETPKTEK